MSQPVTMLFGQSGTGRSIVLEHLMFEETYRTIDPLLSLQYLNDRYVSDTVNDAWQLWQKARRSPEYVNRATVELIQDLLKVVEGNDIFEFHEALRQRAESFINMNADKLNNVVVGPWTDGKKV